MLEDILQNRQHILVCIQYEVLQKKSIDEAFKSFCNILGDNAMKYSEFDFWYYHFVNGNFDLDYERKTEPKPLELADMPMDAVKKIVEKLKPIEKCIFRNVSQKCREVVDKKPIIIESMYLMDSLSGIRVSFDNHSFKYGVNKFKEVVSIESHEGATKYDEGDQEKVDLKGDEREECEKRVVQTLAIALNNSRIQIGELSFSINEQTLVAKLNDLFKSLNHQLHVKSFEYYDNQEAYSKFPGEISFMKFLPHLKPGVLKTITLYNSTRVNRELFDSNLEELAKMEQWKQTKRFYTDSIISFINIDKVAHFDSLIVFLKDNIKPEHVVYLKNIYSNSPTFDLCDLHVKNMDQERIREELGGEEFPMADGSTLYVNAFHRSISFMRG